MAILLFSKTTDYRHDSIASGVAALSHWARARGLHLEATEDAGWFEADAWRNFRALVVGGRFTEHPSPQLARLVVEDREHPATRHLGGEWWRSDEWYEFDRNPRASVRVLLSVDEGTYQGGKAGDHPVAWCRELGRARSFYTALCHSPADFADERFMQHLGGGIEWALGSAH